jgi:hypothetical protein
MSLVVDSISITTARMRSRRLPDSSSWRRKSSNCFSSEAEEGDAWASPPAIEEEQRVGESERNVSLPNLKKINVGDWEVDMVGNV